MSIRFKFRSSATFDSVDLGGGCSISVRDLRARIVDQKNLQICRDFDLVIADADSGEAFEDEEFQIPQGSSVVIKRVPASGALPPDLPVGGGAGGNVSKRGGLVDPIVSSPSELNVDIENFDDFGVDLYPAFETSFPQNDVCMGNLNSTANKEDVPRCHETSISKCQNAEGSDLSEAMSKEIVGENCFKDSAPKESKKQIKLEPKTDVPKKLNEGDHIVSPTVVNTYLPTELRCFLCNTIFNGAVMIPCCQHSFCDKCIRLELVERQRCPKCSSKKCTVQDLLPNLSLRQAIEHFLEAQAANNAADNIIPTYAPDGESGIQAKEASCAVSIQQREPPCPHSPSATGRGSNQVMAESTYENKRTGGSGSRLIRLDVKSVKSAASLSKMKQTEEDENSLAETVKPVGGFQPGGNSSKLPQNILRKEEGNIAGQKRKGLGVSIPDTSGIVMPPNKHRKGDRTCYMCGSPNHFIRDCPEASNPYSFGQTGDAAFSGGMPAYGQSYWHGTSFPQRPYANIYGTPGVMPFDPTIVPVSPFGIPSYMPSLYAGMPVPYGYMRMGGAQPPMMTGAERPFFRGAFMDIQDHEWKQKSVNEHLEREHDYGNMSGDDYYNSTRRSHDRKRQLEKEISGSFSDNDSERFGKKHPNEKHYRPSHRRPSFSSDEEFHSIDRKNKKDSHLSVSGKDQRALHSDRSTSEVHDASDSSNHHSRDGKRHRRRRGSKKHNQRRGQCSSDCSRRSHNHSQKEISDDDEKKVAVDHKKRHGHKNHSRLEAGLVSDSSSDRRLLHKEKDSSQSSKHSRKMVESAYDQLELDRWEMVDGLAENYRGHYHHKQKGTR